MRRELKEYAEVVLSVEGGAEPLDFARIFGRAGPVHIEIGSGKGTFLVAQAQAQPEVNFLGIEWARKFYRHAVDRIGRWDLRNVRIVRTDAATFLRDLVPPESVDCFHIYFPDPWPKKRHHKTAVPAKLQSGGPDPVSQAGRGNPHCHRPCRLLRANPPGDLGAVATKLEEIEFEPPAGAREGELTGTNYERKYVKQSRPIYTAAFRKRHRTHGSLMF